MQEHDLYGAYKQYVNDWSVGDYRYGESPIPFDAWKQRYEEKQLNAMVRFIDAWDNGEV